ncbi:MAG: hypothetical protein R3192_08610 [Woeseiaceae bacterium]|nr:hypothetical protein [Woeseiaceae bacterium]
MHRYLHNLDDFLLIDEDFAADAGKAVLHGPKWKRDPEDFDDADEDRKEFDKDDYDDYYDVDENDYGEYENSFDRH